MTSIDEMRAFLRAREKQVYNAPKPDATPRFTVWTNRLQHVGGMVIRLACEVNNGEPRLEASWMIPDDVRPDIRKWIANWLGSAQPYTPEESTNTISDFLLGYPLMTEPNKRAQASVLLWKMHVPIGAHVYKDPKDQTLTSKQMKKGALIEYSKKANVWARPPFELTSWSLRENDKSPEDYQHIINSIGEISDWYRTLWAQPINEKQIRPPGVFIRRVFGEPSESEE